MPVRTVTRRKEPFRTVKPIKEGFGTITDKLGRIRTGSFSEENNRMPKKAVKAIKKYRMSEGGRAKY